MSRTFIVIFLTGITLFLPYFPVFAVSGPGEGGSSEALPGLQPPSLRVGAVIGGESASSTVPAVLPALSAASLESLFGRLLSPVTEALTGLGERLVGIEERLGALENNAGIKTKPLALPVELVAKVAAAVENRKLSGGEDGINELFTSDELQMLQRYFHDNYNLKHHDIYNICLLFLSLNIGAMPLELYNKNDFNYRLLFCLLENILPNNAGATEFQHAKAEVLHCALVIFNPWNGRLGSMDYEEKWFYRGNLEGIDLQGRPLDQNDKLRREFYFKKLLMLALQKFNDPLRQNLTLEACFYVAIYTYKLYMEKNGEDIILDKEFIEEILQVNFDIDDENITNFERIFELIGTKIMRVFYLKSSRFNTSQLYQGSSFFSMHLILKRRIAVAYSSLQSIKVSLKDSDQKRKTQISDERLWGYDSFEELFKMDLMNLGDFPELDKTVLEYLVISNMLHDEGYDFKFPSLAQRIESLQNRDEYREDHILFLSSLMYYFCRKSVVTKEEDGNRFEKISLLQESLKKEFDNFKDRQRNRNSYSAAIYILVAYRVFSHALLDKTHNDSLENFPELFLKYMWERGVVPLWDLPFCDFHRHRDPQHAKGLEIYTRLLIETIVAATLLCQEEKGMFPPIRNLTPMDVGTFRALLKKHWAPFTDADNEFLSLILYRIYPNDIELEDVGLKNRIAVDDARLRIMLTNPKLYGLKVHSYLQNLVWHYIEAQKRE